VENFRQKDYYQILGVSTVATHKEIKAAYRSLARKYHPDVNPGNKLCEEKFKEIGEAYSVLGDENKRKQYDLLKGIKKTNQKTTYSSQQTTKQSSATHSQQKAKTSPKTSTSASSAEKPFNELFSEFLDNIFKKEKTSNPYTRSAKKESSKPASKRGDDITADISITIAEAHNGTVRKINVLHTDVCSNCKGRRIINGSPCISCDGKGEISVHKKINVKIPPGVKEGSKIKIQSEGNKGINGGENGDLYLLIHIQKQSLFTFDNLNVLCEIPITPTEAALGAEITVPSIDGEISMKIPAETQSGQKFRLAGQGISDSKSKIRGDQIVTVKIEIPTNLSEKEKQLYQELARIRKFNPRENIIYE